MKSFTKTLIALFSVISISQSLYSITYTSAAAGPSLWNNSATWSPAGIPTSSDDVVIAAGHTVNVNSTGCVCRHLTVSGSLGLVANTLLVRGDYTVTGSETGGGTILFTSTSTTLTITGSTSSASGYSFNTNPTVAAGSVINKSTAGSAAITLAINKTMTNLGTCTFGTFTGKTGSRFINSTNATLTLLKSGFMTGLLFDAHASGNTVNVRYNTGALPAPTAGYFNLNLSASLAGTKTLPSDLLVANNLSMSAGNHLNSNNFNITVGGNWTNAATFTSSANRSVTFNGTSAQNVSNTSGTTTFKNIVVNNNSGVTLTSGTYMLDESLTISNGTFNTGGRPFTMTSTATQTARIEPITGSGAIAGNFTIQRFITARDTTWADLSSPVQNSTLADWDNELLLYYGAYPTQYTFDESADDFTPITSSGTALTPGQGFEVYMTGDSTFNNMPNTTINTVGVPNQGDQDLSGLISFNSAGSNLVGNPFASSISWSSVFAASSGILNTYDVYDFASGNYATFGLGTEIGSTQGFWVYTTTSAATLLIPESAKTSSTNSSIRSSIPTPFFSLRFSATDNKNNYYHSLKISANDMSSDGWDSNDHPYRKSPNKLAPSIFTTIEGKKAVINTFSSSNDNFSMPVTVNAPENGSYKIHADNLENMNEYTCIRLEDKQLGKIIDLSSGEAYSFQYNTKDNADRFTLHLSKSGNCRSFTNLSAEQSNGIIVLPTSEGNTVSFNMTEVTPATITVTNVLGQNLVEGMSLMAGTQTVNIALPQDFSGMYIIKVESSKGVTSKKYVRK
jgi:hypothetical protein